MGYRSDVAALIYPSTCDDTERDRYEALKVLMKTQFAAIDQMWGNSMTFNDRHMWVEFVETDIKWYPSYGPVQRFMDFLHELPPLGYDFEFMRIGEDDDDVERIVGDHCRYGLRLNRTIEID